MRLADTKNVSGNGGPNSGMAMAVPAVVLAATALQPCMAKVACIGMLCSQ